MDFSKDHMWHESSRFEWKYKWGRILSGRFYSDRFYHIAVFRKNGIKFNHVSLDGEFREFDEMELELPRNRPIVEHASKKINYYSIPGDPWYDHAWGEEVGPNWDWVSLVLNDGSCIMAQEKEGDRLCDVMFSDSQRLDSQFNLDGERLYVFELGRNFFLDPIRAEVIWRPKFGRPYSETPFTIVEKGKVSGFGMRERTYKGD